MDDLRKAAEMALEDICAAKLCEVNSMSSRAEMLRLMDKAAEALRQALAQPKQEPVGYVTDSGKSAYILLGVDLEDDTPLYTAPPKKEWVGLVADEIWKCNKAKSGSAVEFHICVAHQNLLDFAEAIEAKLKEKNT